MPHLLTESTLTVHNCVNDFEDYKARQLLSSELHRVKTWITSLAGPSVTRSRTTSVSSASGIASTLATINTNAESQVSKGSVSRCGSLEEEDEKCGYPSQDRDILGKRAREMAGVREQTVVHYIFVLIVFFF
jgi:hypothetical protein